MREGLLTLFGTCLVMLVTVLPASEARADAIDGHWCYVDGKRMSIDGPTIVTPHGTKMQGNYDRHGFNYIIPRSEPLPGSYVHMNLIDDDTLYVKVSPDKSRVAGVPTQVWRRCKAPIS